MMENTDVEIRTVDTLLNRGVQVEIPAPRLLRWLGKKSLKMIVKSPDSETMLTISGMYLRMKQEAGITLEAGSLDEAHLLIQTCMIPVSRIVAYGMAPHLTPFGLRNRLLARHLRRSMDSRTLAEMASLIVTLSGAHDFCNTIRSIASLKMTTPRTPLPTT